MSLAQRLPLLAQLWQQQQLGDVVLRSADGEDFACHMVILAASSTFFQALLGTTGSQMREFHRTDNALCLPTIELPSVSGEALATVLKAVYTGEVQLNAENVEELLQASSFLALEFIREACCEVRLEPLRAPSVRIKSFLSALKPCIHYFFGFAAFASFSGPSLDTTHPGDR